MVVTAAPFVASAAHKGQAQPRRPDTRSGTGKAGGSLLSHVERVTADAGSPAAALITFANSLSGAGWRVPGKTGLAKKDKPGSIYSASVTPTGQPPWLELPAASPTGYRRLGTGTPRQCYIPQPCWTPLPGSRTHSRLTQSFRSARYYAKCSPSVRAYAPAEEAPAEEATDEEAAAAAEEEQASAKYASEEPLAKRIPSHSDARTMSTPDSAPDDANGADIPWSEAELQNVFNKFSDADEHEVHVEDLPSLLRYIGARPDPDDIDEIIKKQTMYASLDWYEFLDFIKLFRQHDIEQLRAQFDEADNDNNGSLDISELHEMLVNTGYSPTMEATEEALDFIDDDHSGTIEFHEFAQLRDHLRVTRGFLKAEAEEFRMLFYRVARGHERKLPVDELFRISSYIGYHIDAEELQHIITEVDKDHSGLISYDELLGIIRSIRDCEGLRLQDVIDEFAAAAVANMTRTDRKGRRPSTMGVTATATKGSISQKPLAQRSTTVPLRQSTTSRASTAARRSKVQMKATLAGTLPTKELGTALAKLGYHISEDITEEILEINLRQRRCYDRLGWEEILVFIRAYRRVEGFTTKERQSLKECFDREQSISVAGHDDESLDALELGRVLRSFGISRTMQQVQRMINEIDFDGSGQLEFNEFMKLMRQLYQQDSVQRNTIFASLDSTNIGRIHVSKIEEAMTSINGVMPDVDMIRLALQEALGKDFAVFHEEISQADFGKVVRSYRDLLMESVKVNAGFIPSEVEMLRNVFASYGEITDSYDSCLKPTKVRQLVHDLIPEASQSHTGKLEVLKMLDELEHDQSEGLDFTSFLWLMRKCHDQRDERDIVKEAEVVQNCEYSTDEVEGLRQIFSSNIDWTGEISLENVVKLFERIVPVNEREEMEISQLLRNISPFHKDSVRFPDFLTFMRQVIQSNILGLNDATDRVLRKSNLPVKGPTLARQSTKGMEKRTLRRRAPIRVDVDRSSLLSDLTPRSGSKQTASPSFATQDSFR